MTRCTQRIRDLLIMRYINLHFTYLLTYSECSDNGVVRSRTGQPLLSDTIHRRRLSFFGHLCHADTSQNHSRALRACIQGPPKDWRRRTGRPRQTWLRTVNLRMICGRSTLAWRRQDGALWIDQHGVYSWMRLCPRDTLQRQRETATYC